MAPTRPPTGLPTKEPTKADEAIEQPPTSLPTSLPMTHGSDDNYGDPRILNTTIVKPTRAADGTMFTVQALKNLSISALSTHTSKIGDSIIQVYTRQGQYRSHTRSDRGWTLIFDQLVHQQGVEKLTRLALSNRVNVPAGNSASFYVYSSEGRDDSSGGLKYQLKKKWEEGTTITNDGSLKLFAGCALAYGKWEEGCNTGSPQEDEQCVFAPRVFSGVLEYNLVNPVIEFQTVPRKAARISNGRGLMFTIRAKRDIVIKGFNIFARPHAVSNVLVYTRSGTFDDTWLSNSDDSFILLYSGSIPDQQSKQHRLDDFKQSVRITGGETQTFYVFSQEFLMHGHGDELGSAYNEDSSIVIYEGRVTTRWFRKLAGIGTWAGRIRYYNVHDHIEQDGLPAVDAGANPVGGKAKNNQRGSHKG